MSISFDNGNIVLSNGGFNTIIAGNSTANVIITFASVSASLNPAGANSQIQYNLGGTFAASNKLTIDADQFAVVGETTSVPIASAAGTKLFAKNQAGVSDLSYISSQGISSRIQPCFTTTKHVLYTAPGTVSGANLIGGGSTIVGSVVRNVSNLNLLQSTRRLGFVTGAGAGSTAGQQLNASAGCWRGNAAGRGGFHFICRFGMSSAAAVATQRAFIGMTGGSPSVLLGNVEPSTNATGTLGFALDSADTNWFFLCGGATPTKIAIVGTFPVRDLSQTLMEAHIFCAPGGSTISYSLEVIGGAFTSGSTSTNLPANTIFFVPQIWTSNGSTAIAAGIDLVSMTVETPY
jgi:hypothetical protein